MLITNIRLFDGTTDNLIEDSSIWVEDNSFVMQDHQRN